MLGNCSQAGAAHPHRAFPCSILEVRVLDMEAKHQAELAGIRSEKERLQHLVSRQSGTIQELEKSLLAANANASLLQRQQLQLLESVQSLVRLVAEGRGEWGEPKNAASQEQLSPVPRDTANPQGWGDGRSRDAGSAGSLEHPPAALRSAQPCCLLRSSASRTAPRCSGPAAVPAGCTPCTSPT